MVKNGFFNALSVSGAVAIFAVVAVFNVPAQKVESVSTYIVQGDSLAEVKAAIIAVGGEITHELGIISAVGVELSAGQRAELERLYEGLRVLADRQLETASRRDHSYSKEQKEAMKAAFEAEMEATEAELSAARKALKKDKDNAELQAEIDNLLAKLEHFNKMLDAIDKNLPQVTVAQHVGATELHAQGITGAGVTVAILDTGIWHDKQIRKDGRLGTVIAAYKFAERAGVEGFDGATLLEMRNSGMNWGEIRREMGLNGPPADKGKPDNPGNGHGRPDEPGNPNDND